MNRTSARCTRLIGAAAAAVLLSSVAACGGSSDSPSDSAAAGGGSGSEKVDKIAALLPPSVTKDGSVKIAAAAYAPAVIAPTSGSKVPSGWDADLMTAAADVLGVKADYVMIPFDGIITGLQAERYDTAVGDIGINDDRLKSVSFVLNHTTRDLFVVPADSKAPDTFETATDVCGLSVGVLLGSQEAGFATSAKADCKAAGKDLTIKTFQDQATVNLAVAQGRVDANLTDEGTAGLLLETSPGKFKTVEVPFVPVLPTGFAFPNNDDTAKITEAFAAAVNYLIETGEYDKITAKYFKDGDEGKVDTAEVYSTTVPGAKTSTK